MHRIRQDPGQFPSPDPTCRQPLPHTYLRDRNERNPMFTPECGFSTMIPQVITRHGRRAGSQCRAGALRVQDESVDRRSLLKVMGAVGMSSTLPEAAFGPRPAIGDVARATSRRTFLQRRKLYWDPVKEHFKNDDEANCMLLRPQRAPYMMDV